MNASGGDEPHVPKDPHQDELRDGSAKVRPPGYYDKFAESMASRKPALARSDSEDGDTRTVARSGQMRADAYVDDVVQTWNLPDLTDTYDYVTPLSEGNQGDVYFMLNKAKPYALKIYKTGVNRQYTEFQKDLLRNIDNPEAKAHPGYEAVYFAAMPVGWAIHMGKKGLVFRYVTPPRKSRRPTAEDRAQVRDQIDFLHWLGYVHLDITDRNIMLADRGRCYLMDYDCVCKIDEVPLGPVPTESTEAILTQRFPAEIDDDEHLWQLLQTTFFHELPVDEAYLVPVQLSSAKPSDAKTALAQWSAENKWRTVSVDPFGSLATKSGGVLGKSRGYIQSTEPISKGVYTWKVRVIKKPANEWLFIGVSAPGIQPDINCLTTRDSSSYGMFGDGDVRAAGQRVIDDYTKLPASSIMQANLLEQRATRDKVFRAGDEVVVVLDCTAHTLRLQTPIVQHVIPIQHQHHQQHWVLNVNFGGGDHQLILG